MERNRKPKDQKSVLVGVGLDNDDGHKRVTKADNFAIVGGSEETHTKMTETVIKTFEEMGKKGKTLDSIDPKHLKDLIEKNKPQ